MRFSRRAALLGPLAAALIGATPRRRRPAGPPPPPAPLGDSEYVELTTELGRIVVMVDVRHAPVTAANFIRYVDARRFDGIVFYRAMRLAWGTPPNGLVQAGIQNDPKRLYPPIAHEPTNVTGILHKAGTLSMARYAPGTATGDFSIMMSDQPGLDADPSSSDPDRQAGYAAFGQVMVGMDVVKAIFDAPVSPTKGEGGMRGQLLEKPVKILAARRVVPPPTPPAPTRSAIP